MVSHAGVPVGLESDLLSGTFDFVEILILSSAWDSLFQSYLLFVCHFFFVPYIDWYKSMMSDDITKIGPIDRDHFFAL